MLLTLAIIFLTLIVASSIMVQITQNREIKEIEKHRRICEERQKLCEERQKLYREVLNYLRSSTNVDSMLKEYDDTIKVNSRQALNNYNDIKYLKEKKCFDKVMKVALMRNDIKDKIDMFLKQNNFKNKLQYNYVEEQLHSLLNKSDFRVRVVYTTPATNKTVHTTINFSVNRLQEIQNHPEWLMTKTEYNNMLKLELENKKHCFYEKINSIIDFANDAKDLLIVKTRIKLLDELIQQLFDGTINNIQMIKQIDSQEWCMLDKLITNIKSQVSKIVDDDKKISNYYASEDFKKLKDTCNSLYLAHKEFNEYINKKAKSISKLFGTRVVRNETHHEDTYHYIRKYKKTITPFTAEVSSAVFGSAENNPINYVIKFFYPNKGQYKEQIQKLKILIEELQTLKEAKTIIDNYKTDYEQYITDVPSYVLENDEDGFYSRLGLPIIDEAILNVDYKIVYTSNGRMAQRFFTVPMNEENIIELINSLENKLSMSALANEQRIKMTTKLRRFIIKRDNFTCCLCGNSTKAEPNLLLEVDHIIPISKGGLTVEDNLRTLCWKCNRRKGAKLI